ncbi:hypothetical protein EPA93_37690 [Ktedonosporobacter rubrisoli]|uniref:Glycosyltransferase RgtA/B/C/D-like domain-containing protein n=1 Tax=Ktedonosporobacter rubrisoli TaxID=2509675 RepID=A0A4P6K0S8_KTERU|nr:glycosyltransferase family 39 protein [Ktedonosporobacter rubrisoli]QBD81402.1 hypothetical protein EPA93_37690 [Ktedonosporobacter rubrisoli]
MDRSTYKSNAQDDLHPHRNKIDSAESAVSLATHSAKSTRQTQRATLSLPFQALIGIVFCALALALNLYRLGEPSIWFDEAFSVELAHQPLPLLWHIIFGVEPNMELYYLFLHFWLNCTTAFGFNPTEIVVRLPSAIFAMLSTGVVFCLGRRFISPTAGIVAACLYLLNDLQLVYAQQARSYSMQLLLICLAWFALFAALSSPTHAWRWWLVFALAMVLAVYAHLFSLFILLAQVIAIAGLLLLPGQWRRAARKQLLACVISLVVAGILLVPMLLMILQGSRTSWLTVPNFHDLFHLFTTISGDNKLYLLSLGACCALGVLVVLATYGLQHRLSARHATFDNPLLREDVERCQAFLPITWSLLCWLLVPMVVSYVLSHGSMRVFSSRYLVTIVPALMLLVSLGVVIWRWRTVKILLTLDLVVLALSTVPLYYQSAQVEDWNSTTHWLEQQYQPADGLVCYDNTMQEDAQQGCQISVEYYLHAYPSQAHFTADMPGAFSWENFGSTAPGEGADAAVDPKVLGAYGAKHERLFFIVGRVRDDEAATKAQIAQQWLDNHYTFLDQIITRTVTIRLYATDVK